MKQPELGSTISEIRKQRGITQKDLAESCNIDIRTLQRIETGSVTPRLSTLKLLATALSYDFNALLDEQKEIPTGLSSRFLGFIFTVGLFYFPNWLLMSSSLTIHPSSFNNNIVFSNVMVLVIYTILGVIFNYGISRLAKHYENKLLQITSFIEMACIPLSLITFLIAFEHHYDLSLNALALLSIKINAIFIGIGLFNTKSPRSNWYKIAGILQLIAAPFYLIKSPITHLIGNYLYAPCQLLLIIIVYLEYRASKQIKA